MRAGNLRKRVTFQRRTLSPDGGGGGAAAWSELFTVWGALRPERGQERIQAGRLAELVAGTLQVRASALARTLTSADRALIDGVPYQLRAVVNPDQRNRALEFTVERGAAT